MSQRKTVNVHILDKDYPVSCGPEEEADLLASAKHLDQAMRGIRGSGKVIGLERIAVMAALNITNDMLTGTPAPGASDDTAKRLKRINGKIDETLHRCRQLQL